MLPVEQCKGVVDLLLHQAHTALPCFDTINFSCSTCAWAIMLAHYVHNGTEDREQAKRSVCDTLALLRACPMHEHAHLQVMIPRSCELL